jgi:hypothetical protein
LDFASEGCVRLRVTGSFLQSSVITVCDLVLISYILTDSALSHYRLVTASVLLLFRCLGCFSVSIIQFIAFSTPTLDFASCGRPSTSWTSRQRAMFDFASQAGSFLQSSVITVCDLVLISYILTDSALSHYRLVTASVSLLFRFWGCFSVSIIQFICFLYSNIGLHVVWEHCYLFDFVWQAESFL